MSRLLGIGAAQLKVSSGDTQKRLDNLANQIALIKFYSPWVNLVAAPELCLQGISNMQKTAEKIPGSITESCARIAKDNQIYLIPGSIYEKDGNKYYNTSPVFDKNGNLIAKYRKMHPWRPHEKTVSGDKTVVFNFDGIGMIGLCICYDLWFPELIRDLVWKGAEIILVPTLTRTQDRAQEIVLSQAAAIQNQCYIVSVNGVGNKGKGESLIVDPEGNITQKAGQIQENLIQMIDLDNVQKIRNFGVAGVSRPLASFFHEQHRFKYQTRPFSESEIYKKNSFNS
jgi:formamidase